MKGKQGGKIGLRGKMSLVEAFLPEMESFGHGRSGRNGEGRRGHGCRADVGAAANGRQGTTSAVSSSKPTGACQGRTSAREKKVGRLKLCRIDHLARGGVGMDNRGRWRSSGVDGWMDGWMDG